jgi:hypothetical protein
MIHLDRYAERLLQSVHGGDAGPGRAAVRAALGYVVYRIEPPAPRLAGLMRFGDVARYGERRLYVAAAAAEACRVRTAHLLGHTLLHCAPPPPHSAGVKDTVRVVALATVVPDPRRRPTPLPRVC